MLAPDLSKVTGRAWRENQLVPQQPLPARRCGGSGPGGLRAVALLALFLLAEGAAAANYPLELVSPRAVGTSPAAGEPGIPANHRIFRAYPGLEYNIRAVVIGGAYPYVFSLVNAPSGMTIDPGTGQIVWPNPQADARPTIEVIDSEGTRRSSSWSITVTRTGFHFLDAVNGRNHPTGTGTIDNPWRTIKDMVDSPNAGPGHILYWRDGTYNALDLPRTNVGASAERVTFRASSKPAIWLAYPGESPVLDFGYVPGVERAPLWQLYATAADNYYLDGLETTRSRMTAFRYQSGDGHYAVFRRLKMHNHNFNALDYGGENPAGFMFEQSYGTPTRYTAIQDNEFFDFPADGAFKSYSQWKLLIEGNHFHDMDSPGDLKAETTQWTVRGNVLRRLTRFGFHGNMGYYGVNSGEICFNLILDQDVNLIAVELNQNGEAKQIDVYRNTIVGRVRIRNTDSADGPFRFYRNVIVNTDDDGSPLTHLIRDQVSDPGRITSQDNITGLPAEGIVDSNGNLTGTFTRYLGTHGFQIGNATTTVPSPPSQLTVE